MVDKWKKAGDNNKFFGAVLTELLIAKLNGYGLLLPVLKLIKDYLQNQKQRTKIGSFFSNSEDITSEVPQRFNSRLLLFNIFLCDLFLQDENNYFENFVDETTSYIVSSTATEVLENLSNLTTKLFPWFSTKRPIINVT